MSDERTAMDEWVLLFASRDELAIEYARLLQERPPTWPTWVVLNVAIMDRWSSSGLNYIKQKAWKLASAWTAAGTDTETAA